MKKYLWTASLVALATTMVGGAQANEPANATCPGLERAVASVKANLPNTPIASLKCAPIFGLYELVSGPNVVYLNEDASRMVVGSVFDLKTGTDLTASVISEARGGTVVKQLQDGQAIGPTGSAAKQAPDVAPETVNVALFKDLPQIVHGNPRAKQTVYVFGDPHCGFCQRLNRALVNLGDQVRVVEMPMNTIADSRVGLVSIMCSPERDRPDLLKAMYDGEAVATKSCAEGEQALSQVSAFARGKGWDGTPVIVRADGAVMRGFRSPEHLRQFINAKV